MDPAPADSSVTTCYRHPDRRAGVRCQRCSRPICPSCMIQASVGFHCPDCVHAGAKRAPVYSARSLPREIPLATYVLIGLNVAVFLLEIAGGMDASGFGSEGGVLERFYTVAVTASPTGALDGGVAQGEWWRLLTGGFLHIGVIHLLANMYALWILGRLLEPALGTPRFVALYLASLLAGSLGVMITAPAVGAAGASGAIFGLLGAAFVILRARGVNPWSTGIGTVIVLNLVLTFTVPFLSLGGHLGGLAGGALAAWVMLRVDHENRNTAAAVGSLLALSAVFVVAAVLAAGQWAHPLLDIGR